MGVRGGGHNGGASNERSVAIESRAARARKERQFYGQLGDTSGLVDHRTEGLDIAHTHTHSHSHNLGRIFRLTFFPRRKESHHLRKVTVVYVSICLQLD